MFSLGQLIAVGALDEQHVRSELTSASSASGYPARDGERAMLATLDSGLASGKGKPRTPWPPVGHGLSEEEIAAIRDLYGDDPATMEWLLGEAAGPDTNGARPAPTNGKEPPGTTGEPPGTIPRPARTCPSTAAGIPSTSQRSSTATSNQRPRPWNLIHKL